MARFIEVHERNSGKVHLINVEHIVEVVNNVIYTDDITPNLTDFPHCPCEETYEDIKQLIYNATHEVVINE